MEEKENGRKGKWKKTRWVFFHFPFLPFSFLPFSKNFFLFTYKKSLLEKSVTIFPITIFMFALFDTEHSSRGILIDFYGSPEELYEKIKEDFIKINRKYIFRENKRYVNEKHYRIVSKGLDINTTSLEFLRTLGREVPELPSGSPYQQYSQYF